MRGRVERLVDTGGRRLWVSTFHAFCARILRREGGVDLTRDFVIYDSADQLAVVRRILRDLDADDKRLPARQALSEISHAKNQMRSPGSLRGESWSARGELLAKVYEQYRRTLAGANALDFDDLLLETKKLFETAGAGAAPLRGALPLCHGRRVPGHQRAAVPPHPAPDRRAPQPVRRRRPRPVHLQVARRRPAQHPRLRAGLPRSHGRPPRAELPFDPGHPRRGRRGHPSEPEPPGQAAVDRPRRGAPSSAVSGAATSSRRPTSSPRASARPWPPTRPRSACCTGPTPSPARSRTRSSERGSPTRSWAASGSTSAGRSRTRWPISGC